MLSAEEKGILKLALQAQFSKYMGRANENKALAERARREGYQDDALTYEELCQSETDQAFSCMEIWSNLEKL
jgi:hypothetical protein